MNQRANVKPITYLKNRTLGDGSAGVDVRLGVGQHLEQRRRPLPLVVDLDVHDHDLGLAILRNGQGLAFLGRIGSYIESRGTRSWCRRSSIGAEISRKSCWSDWCGRDDQNGRG